jgi:hypothetical protein
MKQRMVRGCKSLHHVNGATPRPRACALSDKV